MINEYHSLNKKIKEVADFSDKYVKENLNIEKEKLKSDWWEASKFFFSRAFYQGRSNVISKEVERRAIEVLSNYFNDRSKRDEEFQRLKDNEWKELKEELEKKIGKGKIGRKMDINMVISYFNFISKLEEKNIVKYSISQIKAGRLKDHFHELQRAKDHEGIISVGPKIASLYLIDLVCIFNLENYISKENMIYLLPIDTWIRKIVNELEIIRSPKLSNEELKKLKIINKCDELHISPIKFNQGAWYVGFKHILRLTK